MNVTQKAVLKEIEILTDDISNFVFQLDSSLPSKFEPGCHIDIVLPNDVVRNYTVWSWKEDQSEFSIAVKREANGKGGSIAVHALSEGDTISIGGPRNHFPLNDLNRPIILIAGGIGVTPIYAMAVELNNLGIEFEVIYLVRTLSQAAFHSRFEALNLRNYTLRADDKDGLLDIKSLLSSHDENSDYYVCGPEPLLQGMEQSVEELGRGRLFFERFSAAESFDQKANTPFIVKIDSTGEEIPIGADETILNVLKNRGFNVNHSCSSGLCGSCITGVLEGEIEHRDGVLDEEEREEGDCMCICVSRGKSSSITLDL
jgi:vanillate O-demethylase ferredoxin subunit